MATVAGRPYWLLNAESAAGLAAGSKLATSRNPREASVTPVGKLKDTLPRKRQVFVVADGSKSVMEFVVRL